VPIFWEGGWGRETIKKGIESRTYLERIESDGDAKKILGAEKEAKEGRKGLRTFEKKTRNKPEW